MPRRCQPSRLAAGGSDGPGTVRCSWAALPSLPAGRLTPHRPPACSKQPSPPGSITSTRPSTTVLALANALIRDALYPYPSRVWRSSARSRSAGTTSARPSPRTSSATCALASRTTCAACGVAQLAAVNLRLPGDGPGRRALRRPAGRDGGRPRRGSDRRGRAEQRQPGAAAARRRRAPRSSACRTCST